MIVFITILFLFYLNVFGDKIKINFFFFSFKFFGCFIGLLFILNVYNYPYEFELFLPLNFKLNYLIEDFYESLFNDKLNDFFSLFLGYYVFNSFELILIGLLLLFASLVCVNLNKFNSNLRLNNYYDFFVIFDFFEDFLNFTFLRKQNLNDQTIQPASIRFVKKKK